MKRLMLVLAVAAASAHAAPKDDGKKSFPTPIEINLTSPLQLPWGERDVYGLRLNLL